MDLSEPALLYRLPSMENDAQPPAADIATNDEHGNGLREGLYTFRNKRARTLLDIWAPGEACHGVVQGSNALIGHQIWLIHCSRADGIYTVKNLQHAKYLEVESGSSEKRSRVISGPRIMEDDTRLNQEWRIEELEAEEYMLKSARTNTFLEIAEGNPSDAAKVTCSGSDAAIDKDCQIWTLTRVSRTGSEIKAIFESWKQDILPRIIQPHAEQTEYFVLPHELRQQLWKDTKLVSRLVRPGVFDYNDFVIKSKEAVSSWARDQLPVQIQGVSTLFGMMFGETRRGTRAYNWYLTPDMYSLVFFDAQTGQEYSPAALEVFGFEPMFVTF